MRVNVKEKNLMGGKRKLELIAVYLTKEKKMALEEWATSEERSVSWIVGKLVDKALQDRQQQQVEGEPDI